MADWEKRQIRFDGKGIYFAWTAGPPDRLPLIFLPGFSGDHRDFQEVGSALSDLYRVIILDYPGWLESRIAPRSVTVEYYADYAQAVLAELGVTRAVIVGHSLGAGVAGYLAGKYPGSVGSLFLVSTPYTGSLWLAAGFNSLVSLARLVPRVLRPVFFLWRSRFCMIFLDLLVMKYSKFSQTIARIAHDFQNRPGQLEEVVESLWLSGIGIDYQQLLSRLNRRLTLIHGGRDALVSVGQVRKLQSLLPDADLRIIPSAGHNPQLETPQEFAGVIKNCLLSYKVS